MEKVNLNGEAVLDAKIRQYEPMVHAIMAKLSILYDRDDFLQVGRIAIYQALVGFDASKARGATESQFVYTRIYQRLIDRSEEHTSELQSRFDLVCRLLLVKTK